MARTYAQVTISPSFQAKMTKLEELYGDKIEDKLVRFANDAIEISPVDTGAFVESWSLVPIGSGPNRRISSEGKPSKDYTLAKSDARTNVARDAARLKDRIIKDGGAALRNGAPHAKEVDKKYQTVGRVRDRFR